MTAGMKDFFRMNHIGRIWRVITAVLLFAAVIAAAYSIADRSFMRKNREKYRADTEWLGALIAVEKQWIRQNQGDDGQIYMNGEKAGDVDPYFACHAALGLLADACGFEPQEEDIMCVRKYLNWHTARLIESGGIAGVYRYADSELIRLGKADSVDAYLGTYLELMGNYIRLCEGADGLERWEEGISLAVKTLRKLTAGSLTAVSFNNSTQYLMDNLEVWKGLCALESCFKSGLIPENSLAQTGKAAEMLRKGLESTIPKAFWDAEHGRWCVTADASGFDGGAFYPDGIAQVYPLIFAFPVEDSEAQAELYRIFTEKFAWQDMDSGSRTFIWAMTSLAAAQAGDTDTLKHFLKNYEAKAGKDRSYPLYTGEAGWVCRGGAALYGIYSAEANRHLFQ